MTLGELQDLIRERDHLDARIRQNMDELNAMGIGLEGSLVDSEGYPLANFDLTTVRTLRGETKSIPCLRALTFRNAERPQGTD